MTTNCEYGAGSASEKMVEHLTLCSTQGTDTHEQKYKHKNLNAILPDPGHIIGLNESQLGKIQCITNQ